MIEIKTGQRKPELRKICLFTGEAFGLAYSAMTVPSVLFQGRESHLPIVCLQARGHGTPLQARSLSACLPPIIPVQIGCFNKVNMVKQAPNVNANLFPDKKARFGLHAKKPLSLVRIDP